jgi:hypothetical protein
MERVGVIVTQEPLTAGESILLKFLRCLEPAQFTEI